MPPNLTVAAVCFIDPDQGLLTVRKRGTAAFMLPGGKLDPGETAGEAAVREVREELGLLVDQGELDELGAWTIEAGNEVGMSMDATVYRARLTGVPAPAAEIEELSWVPIDAPDQSTLAPLLRTHVLPTLSSST